MRKGFLSAVFISFIGANLALAQAPPQLPPAPVTGVDVARPTAKAPEPKRRLLAFLGPPQELPPQEVQEHWPQPGQELAKAGVPLDKGQPVGARFWVNAEVLGWWMKGSPLPPLLTTGPANAAQVPPPGALGAATTGVLYSGSDLARDLFPGGRLTAGFWLHDCQAIGIEAGYFFLGSRTNNFTTGSSGAPGSQVLSRPFFDTSTGQPNVELIAFPGLAAGTVRIQTTSHLQGGELNGLYNLCCSTGCRDYCYCKPPPGYRVDLIGGFRWLELREGLGVFEDIQVSPTSPVFTGNRIQVVDQFNTRNEFYGGQIGIRAEAWWNRVFANVAAKVALGDSHQSVDINGGTVLTPPGGSAQFRQGGLLALPSNSGHYSRDTFAVVPELNVNVGYQLTNNLRIYGGYTFLYWSDVVRPGNAVDLNVNSSRIPTSLIPAGGAASPLFAFRSSDFWAQGISLGVQFRY